MNALVDSFLFSHHQFISCLALHPLCIMIRENEFISFLTSNTLLDIWYRIFLFFCFMEYDNLIMTLSRVCFLYVTDVLQGTSDIDWLKNLIGCLKQVAGKRKSIDCHKHVLFSLALSLFLLFLSYT
jgi:hypothetical protein